MVASILSFFENRVINTLRNMFLNFYELIARQFLFFSPAATLARRQQNFANSSVIFELRVVFSKF